MSALLTYLVARGGVGLSYLAGASRDILSALTEMRTIEIRVGSSLMQEISFLCLKISG